MTADSIDFPFYFYTKLQLQRTRVHAVEECLTTMSRPSEEGVMLLYKTHDNPVTSGKEWGERLYPGVRDWQPQDLTAVNLPPDGERGQLVAGFGPPGASIDDLISKPMWLMLNEVDIYNVSVVVLRGAWCSFSAANSRTCLDVVGFLNLLKKQRQLRFKL
jgi:hypothetical protein